MEKIHWVSDQYSVGNEVLDEQHMKIVNLINTLIDMVEEGHNKSDMLSVLIEMDKYASSHFSTEENMLSAVNYPGLDEQKDSHERYQEHISGWMMTSSGRSVAALMSFLTTWWRDHILIDDMKYKSHL